MLENLITVMWVYIITLTNPLHHTSKARIARGPTFHQTEILRKQAATQSCASCAAPGESPASSGSQRYHISHRSAAQVSCSWRAKVDAFLCSAVTDAEQEGDEEQDHEELTTLTIR